MSDPYYVSYFTQFFVQLFTLIFAIWNLDFFWSWYGYICIYPDLKYRKYLCLSMLLVSTHYSLYYSPSSLSSYMIILPLLFGFGGHLNFHRCLAVFRRHWNIRSYLIHALATFIVLCYVKIFNTSFELLISSQLYDMALHSNQILEAYWYYDGREDMTSKGYLPFLVLALLIYATIL